MGYVLRNIFVTLAETHLLYVLESMTGLIVWETPVQVTIQKVKLTWKQ